jgi:hypothetical protein
MGYPVHKFLEEFEAGDAQLTNIVRSLRKRPEPAEPERVTSARMEEAYARGYEEGRAAAEANANAEVASLQADFEARLERSRTLFSEALADKLISDLREQIADVHASIGDQLVSALLPILRHALTEACVRDLAHGLDDLLSEDEAITVELRGPKELIDRVANRLDETTPPIPDQTGPRFKCVVDEASELKVIAKDTIIEARLMNWIRRIEAAVA